MKLEDAKMRFIETWGTLGTNWGINKTMAQIHALMLVSEESLSTDEVMAKLNISRGNANMNIRTLIDWGLVERRVKLGERMEYFAGERDIWKVAIRIISERKKREIDPLRSALKSLTAVIEENDNSAEAEHFRGLIQDIDGFAESAEKVSDTILAADQKWFFGSFMRMIIS